MNKNDLRYIKTENIIKKSFADCVYEYGFEKVTVSLLCKKGLISRNAFYIHYTDKYDLLDRLFDEFKSSVIKSYNKNIYQKVVNKDVLSATELYADAMVENRRDFLLLIRCSKDHMENIIKEVIVENPIRNTVKNYDEIADDIKIRLNIRYMFSAMVAYTELWLENYDKISKKDAVFELYRLCETPTLLFLDNFI